MQDSEAPFIESLKIIFEKNTKATDVEDTRLIDFDTFKNMVDFCMEQAYQAGLQQGTPTSEF